MASRCDVVVITGGRVADTRGKDGSFTKLMFVIPLSVLCLSCGGEEETPTPFEPVAPTSLQDLFGNTLVNAEWDDVSISTIEGTAIVAIYFAAGWCPVCEEFTPYLVDAYEELETAGRSFEVVYVSFDDAPEDMLDYMREAEMPWLAVPYGSVVEAALKSRYDAQFVPKLVVVDAAANTISLNATAGVVENGAQAYDDWLAASGG